MYGGTRVYLHLKTAIVKVIRFTKIVIRFYLLDIFFFCLIPRICTKRLLLVATLHKHTPSYDFAKTRL